MKECRRVNKTDGKINDGTMISRFLFRKRKDNGHFLFNLFILFTQLYESDYQRQGDEIEQNGRKARIANFQNRCERLLAEVNPFDYVNDHPAP